MLLAVLLFGWNLWGYDLWAPDEPYFGEGAREMIADGEWLVPHVNGEITTDKPPLFFWLIALGSLPFGISSFTARLPSMLAALGTLLLLMRLAERIAGRRTALLAGALLVTAHMFWDKARMAQIDSLLCFLIMVALTAFADWRAAAGDDDRAAGRRAGLLFWTACALAVLAKGPVGLLLPLGIALATLAFDRDLRAWRGFAPIAGPALFAAIGGAWIVATVLWGGDYSVAGALREHFVDRAIHGMHHAQPPWYYLKVLPYALLPWSFLLPGALWLAWRRRREPGVRFLLVWSLFVLLFFTVSTEKRDLYILPAVPAMSLLIAQLVATVAGWRDTGDGGTETPSRRWVTLPQGFVGAVMLAAAAAIVLLREEIPEVVAASSWGLAAVLALGGAGILAQAARGRALAAVAWSGGTMAAAMLYAATFVLPAMNPEKSGRALAYQVRDATVEARTAGRPVLGYRLKNIPRWINFYSPGIYLDNLASPEELLEHLDADGPIYLVADQGALPALPAALARRQTELYEVRLSRKDVVFLRFE